MPKKPLLCVEVSEEGIVSQFPLRKLLRGEAAGADGGSGLRVKAGTDPDCDLLENFLHTVVQRVLRC